MKSRWILFVLGVAVIAGIAAIVFYSRSEDGSPSRSASRIKIEMRAMPTATIFIDGKKMGTTPMSLQFTASTKELVIEAEMIRSLVRPGARKVETYRDLRKVTLDRDQTLDFTLSTAKRVDTKEQLIER